MGTTLDINKLTKLNKPEIQNEPKIQLQKGSRNLSKEKKGGAGALHVPQGRDMIVIKERAFFIET